MLEIPEREILGGCEKHELNCTMKPRKGKQIKMHTLLVHEVLFQITIKMSENRDSVEKYTDVCL